MGRVYYKKLPLFHLYDSDLTGTLKLSELDELRRTVDAIPAEVIRAYTAQKYVHHGRMNQEI